MPDTPFRRLLLQREQLPTPVLTALLETRFLEAERPVAVHLPIAPERLNARHVGRQPNVGSSEQGTS